MPNKLFDYAYEAGARTPFRRPRITPDPFLESSEEELAFLEDEDVPQLENNKKLTTADRQHQVRERVPQSTF